MFSFDFTAFIEAIKQAAKGAAGNVLVLLDGNSWALLIFGAMLFGSNIPLPPNFIINGPLLVTLLQIAGGVFIVCAFCIVASRIFWPKVSVSGLLELAMAGQLPAALVLGCLMLFNGLAILGFCVWMALAFNGGR